MKQKAVIFLMIFVLALSAGCSKQSAAIDKSAEEVAQSILDEVTFRDTLIKAEGDVADNYYNLDDTVVEHAIYISGSGATAEEVAVLKLADAKHAESAKGILNARVEELIFRFESYVPAEMVKLEAPVIVAQGNFVILVLADDTQSAKTAAENALKE